MACNCADTVDEKLAERNTRLTRALMVRTPPERANNPNLLLQTDQIETGRGKKKAVSMLISFCPFCGAKYDAEEVCDG